MNLGWRYDTRGWSHASRKREYGRALGVWGKADSRLRSRSGRMSRVQTIPVRYRTSPHARIVGCAFEVSIRRTIVGSRSLDRDIVDVGDRPLRNFITKDVSDVVMEDQDRIGPAHRELGESHEPKGRLEGGEISGLLS